MRPGLGHAHTLPYDAALIEPYQTGRPLPPGQWAAVTRVTGPASYFPSIEKKYGKRHRRSGTRPATTTI
ncbi:MAG: hypothetical protein WAK83_28710 [Trebonia sp.]|uniref:hypothetical protein n=1 Tax=Trebonia sp. TaxID=2767075 RepID=UPI003BB10916